MQENERTRKWFRFKVIHSDSNQQRWLQCEVGFAEQSVAVCDTASPAAERRHWQFSAPVAKLPGDGGKAASKAAGSDSWHRSAQAGGARFTAAGQKPDGSDPGKLKGD